jgi:hypothetical protein
LYSVNLAKTTEVGCGRALWEKINYFKELTHNFRINSDDEIFYTEFLKKARLGNITELELLELNGRCIQINIEEAINNTINESKTIWLAPTLKNVKEINNINISVMKDKVISEVKTYDSSIRPIKNLTIDVIAKHLISGKTNIQISESKELFKRVTSKKNELKFPPPILTLSIGSRVKVVSNIATCLG